MGSLKAELTDGILDKALAGERISPAEGLALYESADFLKVMAVARELRNRKNDPSTVTYTMFRIVNYTSLCDVQCSFCSFSTPVHSGRGFVLSAGDIIRKMNEAVGLGANQMFLQGGVNPNLPFDYYLNIIRAVRETFGPQLHIRAFSPIELLGMEKISTLPLTRILRELKDAGLNSVPGAGAEILSDRMREALSPRKGSVSEWVRVMETCHHEGLPGSANIVFGSEETGAEIVEHLRIVRDLQDRTGGFFAFIPWVFQKQTNRFAIRNVAPHEFLKVLGICRMFLDNIAHIEASVLVMGQGIGSIALHAGADDISSVVIEENVLKSQGINTEERAREFIRASGFEPAKRDLFYREMK
jgi:cyclic dehypoxanthinyl futalosine synthase